MSSILECLKSLKESSKTVFTKELADELDKKAKEIAKDKYGFTDEYLDYIEVELVSDNCITFHAELSYEEMDDIVTELDKIFKNHNIDAYFDADEPGRWSAYTE